MPEHMDRSLEQLNEITGCVVDSAVRIHQKLGPGLFESVYERILARDLIRQGYRVERQKRITLEFEGMRIPNVARVDMLVEQRVIVEVKSVVRVHPAFEKQLLTYLRLLDCRLGLLLNFGAPLMKTGIKRVINGYL